MAKTPAQEAIASAQKAYHASLQITADQRGTGCYDIYQQAQRQRLQELAVEDAAKKSKASAPVPRQQIWGTPMGV